MLSAGAAIIDITPPAGLLMTGYVARTAAATGAHDPLTVRAVVYGDCAIVVADVIGVHEDMSLRVRNRACLPADNIIVSALHNHGAPASMPGRLAQQADKGFLDSLEQACVDAIAQAVNRARPCRLYAGIGESPGVAINRRHVDGLVDDALPVVTLVDEAGDCVATLVSYACHPVVLGADNMQYTADYPFYVRRQLEDSAPGSVALFITGAAADANTGHSASDSITLTPNNQRTYREAQRIGVHIAHCAQQAALAEAGYSSLMVNRQIQLLSDRTETRGAGTLAANWKKQLKQAKGAQLALLECWIYWAESTALQEPQPLSVRVSVMRWGGIVFVALPGEIFAATAVSIYKLLAEHFTGTLVPIIVAYADSNPGYIPPESEFKFGGYEVDEAHRFYGRPATFAPDSTDRLLGAVTACLAEL